MKKLAVVLGVVLALALAMHVQAGQALNPKVNLNSSIAPPHSHAFGKSLDGWMRSYVEWLVDGADPDARVKNASFLPIIGDSPFEVEIEAGTALVLPVALYLGFPEDQVLDRALFSGEVRVDGKQIVLDESYYVGPGYFDDPLPLGDGYFIAYYQGLVLVIKPLTPGEHLIELHSEIQGYAEFDNIWNVTVVPGKIRK